MRDEGDANEHRNAVYRPGTQALGFSMFKEFPVHESAHFHFHCAAFNLLNTPTFGSPNETVHFDANGGTTGNGSAIISSTIAASSPRQIQLALKFIF